MMKNTANLVHVFFTILFNFILSISVCGLLGCGVWLLFPFVYVLSMPVVITLIVVPATLAILFSFSSLLGWCGSHKRKRKLLFVSASFNTFTLFMFLNLFVGISIFRQSIGQIIQDDLYKSLNDASTKDNWDRLQIAYGCCGVLNSTDWNTNANNDTDSCNGGSTGCYSRLEQFFADEVWTAMGIGSLEFLVLLAIVVTYDLGKRVKVLGGDGARRASDIYDLTNLLERSRANPPSAAGSMLPSAPSINRQSSFYGQY